MLKEEVQNRKTVNPSKKESKEESNHDTNTEQDKEEVDGLLLEM